MSILSRIGRGFALARDSVDVLKATPQLLWFPVVAGVAGVAYLGLLVGAAYGAVPVFGSNVPPAVGWALLAAGYLGTSFIAVLFTAALMYAARDAIRGGDPSVRAGLRGAWNHKGTLFAWAIVSAVVGLVVRALEESDSIASIVAGVLLGVAWSVVTYFVVPVAIFEDETITGVFGRSVDLVRNTWGESLGAEFGLGFVHFFLFAPVAVVAVFVWLVTQSVPVLVAVALPLAVLAFVASMTLNGIAKVALYEYAEGDQPPKFFENVDFSVGSDGRSRASSGVLGGD